MTYDLARIEAAVRAVAPEAVIQSDVFCLFDDSDCQQAIRVNARIVVWEDGRYHIDGVTGDRAIVRAVLDSLDAQDAARGEGDR